MNKTHRELNIKLTCGIYKGKSLKLPADKQITRATKSIVRTACINSLRQDLAYSIFVECFAGSGSVGIQALSEGAAFAVFLEQNTQVLANLNANITALNINNTKTFLANSFDFTTHLLEFLKQFDQKLIFYLDPPFNIRQNQDEVYHNIQNLMMKLPTSQVIIEHYSQYKFPSQIGIFTKQKSKKFGKTTLSYFK